MSTYINVLNIVEYCSNQESMANRFTVMLLDNIGFVLCIYERFRVDGWKRYVNDDRLRVDGDKNMRLLAFAFTIVFVWTGPETFFITSKC